MFLLLCFGLVVIYFLVDWLRRLPKVGSYRNKHIFVTGCDSGFGRELVLKLDSMGFPVFAGCLTESGQDYLRQNSSGRLVTLKLDVTDTASIHSALEKVKANLPNDTALWAVINNAGVPGRLCPSEMCTRMDYIQACEVNLFGPIEVSRIFMPLLRKSQGRLINMVSVMGRCPAVPGPYSVSKFGMEAFSDVLRREVSSFEVKVIVIEPGFFKTTIFNDEIYEREVRNGYEEVSDEVQAAYGKDFVKNTMTQYQGLKTLLCKDTYKVIDAYTHAITAKYHQARYLGCDGADENPHPSDSDLANINPSDSNADSDLGQHLAKREYTKVSVPCPPTPMKTRIFSISFA
ncbi:Retinol dehydrogenase 16 [Bulinus truncatus]|nr:Retinol dehydrogenase 16 [Bulinus truncatus]